MTAILTPLATATPKPEMSLDEVVAEIRRLWTTDPCVASEQREHVLVELTDLDVALERHVLRTRWTKEVDGESGELVRYAETLDRLRRHWQPE